MNKCIICNETYETPDCKYCGKHIFSDDIYFIINSQKIRAQLHVAEKKLLINNFFSNGICVKNNTRNAAFSKMGLLGVFLSMAVSDVPELEMPNENSEIRIALNSIKKVKVKERKGYVMLTVQKLNAKTLYVLHIPNKESRQKLVALLKK